MIPAYLDGFLLSYSCGWKWSDFAEVSYYSNNYNFSTSAEYVCENSHYLVTVAFVNRLQLLFLFLFEVHCNNTL